MLKQSPRNVTISSDESHAYLGQESAALGIVKNMKSICG